MNNEPLKSILRFIAVLCLFPLASCQKQESGAKPAAAGYRLEKASQSIVEGVLSRVSKLPNAPKNSYPDCYYTATLDVRQILAGQPLERKIVLVLPGFFKRQYAPEASYKTGDKIRAVLVPFDSMPDAVKQVQQADEIEEFELAYYFPEKSGPIAEFQKLAAPVEFKAPNQPGAAPRAAATVPVDREAQAARKKAIQQDLDRINALLARHGGDWAKWMKETEACRAQYTQQVRAKAKRWVGDSFYAAGEAGADKIYSPEFVRSLIVFKNYLAQRNVDLILVRVPFKSEVCVDLFTTLPADKVFNPQLLQLYKELLEAGVEVIADIIPQAMAAREKYPLMYWYQEANESHPAEGMSRVIAEQLAGRLQRYAALRNAPKNQFQFVRASEPNRDYHWPQGNPHFDPSQFVSFAAVADPAGKIVEMKQTTESQVLVIGSSFIVYPNMSKGASIPHYLAQASGIVPNIMYRNGSDASIPRSLAREGDGFLKNRVVCLYPFHPWAAYKGLSLPPKFDPLRTAKTRLGAYAGEELKKRIGLPAKTPQNEFTFSPKGHLVIKPENGNFGPAGKITLELPPQVATYKKFVIGLNFGSFDYTNITARYEDQTDAICRSISENFKDNYLVFETAGSRNVVLDFSDEISFKNPSVIETIDIYGVQ